MSEHGTNNGYQLHYNGPDADRSPCEPCREARHRSYKDQLKRRVALGVDRLTVDALGTRRRIQALCRMGYSYADIGRLMGMTANPERRVWDFAFNSPKVHINTAIAVDRVYVEYGGKVGPNIRAQRRAIKNRWAPPAAWDDIDDPHCEPTGMTWKELVA